MSVAVAVSSKKTNRAGSIERCQPRHRPRFRATSGRSCSAALRDSWNGPPSIPPGYARWATGGKERIHADCGDRDSPWQDRLQPRGSGRERGGGQAPASAAGEHRAVQQGSSRLRDSRSASLSGFIPGLRCHGRCRCGPCAGSIGSGRGRSRHERGVQVATPGTRSVPAIPRTRYDAGAEWVGHCRESAAVTQRGL
jgi:hypothetical protein